MGLWTTLKNFVVGAPKLSEDLFDKDDGLLVKAGGFINDLHYSDSERIQDAIVIGQGVTEFVKTTLAENTVKSKTRRFVAMLWISAQLALLFVTAMFIPFNTEVASNLFEVATCKIMFYGTGSVIVFFFGGYVWGTYVKGSFKGKKKE